MRRLNLRQRLTWALACFFLSTRFLVPEALGHYSFSNDGVRAAAIHSLLVNDDFRRQWLQLNHYRLLTGGHQYRSDIRNDNFFVAADGRTNPKSELETFAILVDQVHTAPGADVQVCRFPARLRLFDRYGLLPEPWHPPECDDTEPVFVFDEISSISLIFASGYFENPASYFGHTLLRFNQNPAQANSDVLSRSINYGADIPIGEPGHLYVYRGLLGRYVATYTENDALLYSYLYTNRQMRDLWELELALTEDERLSLIAHAQEMMHAEFSYFFFNDNCAHRIARLIEVATGSELNISHGFWLQPSQVARALQNTRESRNLVRAERHHQSALSQFSENYRKASPGKRADMRTVVFAPEIERAALVTEIDNEVLYLALDFFDLEVSRKKTGTSRSDRVLSAEIARAQTLTELISRPPVSLDSNQVGPVTRTTTHSLFDIRPPSLLRGGIVLQRSATAQQFTYRVANNDLLDRRLHGAEVSRFIMGEVELERQSGSTKLSRLVLLDILSLNTSPVRRSWRDGYSWSVTADYSPRTKLCTRCSDAGISGELGRATRWTNSILGYGLLGARLHSRNPESLDYGRITSHFGMVADLGADTTAHLATLLTASPTSGKSDIVVRAEVALNHWQRLDIRIQLDTAREGKRATISSAWYFD